MAYKSLFYGSASLFFLVVVWELLSYLPSIPSFILPSFSHVMLTLLTELPVLLPHLVVTISQAIIGLFVSIVLSSGIAFLMDAHLVMRRLLHPLLVVSQTIPIIALAPVLILWFGYGFLPKIVLIVLMCFFPMTMSLYTGLQSIEKAYIDLFYSWQASRFDMIKYLKIPQSLPSFFSGLKIATSYSVIGSVVAEWLGGNDGLGVYMTRVRKSFDFSKLFAAIILVSVFSLLFVKVVEWIEKRVIRK